MVPHVDERNAQVSRRFVRVAQPLNAVPRIVQDVVGPIQDGLHALLVGIVARKRVRDALEVQHQALGALQEGVVQVASDALTLPGKILHPRHDPPGDHLQTKNVGGPKPQRARQHASDLEPGRLPECGRDPDLDRIALRAPDAILVGCDDGEPVDARSKVRVVSLTTADRLLPFVLHRLEAILEPHSFGNGQGRRGVVDPELVRAPRQRDLVVAEERAPLGGNAFDKNVRRRWIASHARWIDREQAVGRREPQPSIRRGHRRGNRIQGRRHPDDAVLEVEWLPLDGTGVIGEERRDRRGRHATDAARCVDPQVARRRPHDSRHALDRGACFAHERPISAILDHAEPVGSCDPHAAVLGQHRQGVANGQTGLRADRADRPALHDHDPVVLVADPHPSFRVAMQA